MFLNSLKEQSNKVRQKYDELTKKTNPQELEKRISDKLNDKERYKTEQSKYLGMMMSGFNNFEIPFTNIKNSYSYNSVKIEPKHNKDTFNKNLKNNIEPTQAFLFSGFKNEKDFQQQKISEKAQDEKLTNKYINLLIGNTQNYERDINGKLIETRPYEITAQKIKEIDETQKKYKNALNQPKSNVRELKIEQLNKKGSIKEKKQAEKELLEKFNNEKIVLQKDILDKDIQNSRYKKALKKIKQELKENNDENRQTLKYLKARKRKYNAKNYKNEMELKEDVVNELSKKNKQIEKQNKAQNKAQNELSNIANDAKQAVGRNKLLSKIEEKINENKNESNEVKLMTNEEKLSKLNEINIKKAINIRYNELTNEFKGKKNIQNALYYADSLGLKLDSKIGIIKIRKKIAEKEIELQQSKGLTLITRKPRKRREIEQQSQDTIPYNEEIKMR